MSSLPIEAVLARVRASLRQADTLVLQAPPGAGKTTRVPLALLDEPWLGGQRIIMLEPRRLAARAAASFMARKLGQRVGETVGYRTRLDSRVSKATQIEVVTDGILVRRLTSDPSLAGVGVVIFDEFHERNLDADLALALTRYGRRLFRADDALRLIVMSATLDGAAVAAYLDDAPVVESAGRSYHVNVHYSNKTVSRETLDNTVAATVTRALAQEEGSVLVFLPGRAEIDRLRQALGPVVEREEADVMPLFGDLDMDRQRAAIEPTAPGRRKVVLATNIAESSLTIEGVRIVVDSGYQRTPRFDPRTAMTRLRTERISRASATQRAGRAGRQEAGVCYRLWTEAEQRQLIPHSGAEISSADIAPLALTLLKFGVATADELDWLEPPSTSAWGQALDLLKRLGAVTTAASGDARLSRRGELMAELPLHPRLASMMVHAVERDRLTLACDLAALLSVRDIAPHTGVDVAPRLQRLRASDGAVRGTNRAATHEARRLSDRFKRLCKDIDRTRSHEGSPVDDSTGIGALVALAYPDRIARRRGADATRYQLANGRAARLRDDDSLGAEPMLAVADVGGREGNAEDRIYLAAALDADLFDDELADLIDEKTVLAWPRNSDQLVAERQQTIGHIVLTRGPTTSINADARRATVIAYIRDVGLSCLRWKQEALSLRERSEFVRGMVCGEMKYDVAGDVSSGWPDLSDDALLANLEGWLGPWLDSVSHVKHLANVDVHAAIRATLNYEQYKQLDRLAPLRYVVPSGSAIPIDYASRPPVLAVKLQELFGLDATPTLMGGVTLQLHLLSPAGRPIQVTQDLGRFWRGSYRDVAKDMKGRYPKHPWPDDPLSAQPTRHTKRRSS